jgi:HD-GYP domain-containing protein (c-di-GMP phosphodiesterase class II)
MASQAPQQSLDAVAGVAAAGLLHDIGIRAVPAGVLRKPGRLSDGEWLHVRKHPLSGEEILRAIGSVPPDVLRAVRWHHERLDGSGYPDGLPGDAIPWSARAVAIAEVFDSLTSDQPYRARMTPYRALRLMLDEMTAGLDTALIRGFVPQLLQESWMADFQRGLAAPLRPVAAV